MDCSEARAAGEFSGRPRLFGLKWLSFGSLGGKNVQPPGRGRLLLRCWDFALMRRMLQRHVPEERLQLESRSGTVAW